MSKSELACKLQGSAIGFVGVIGTSGSGKQHHCPIRQWLKIQLMHALWCVFPLYPLEVIYSFAGIYIFLL
jgi:hypothetical protein